MKKVLVCTSPTCVKCKALHAMLNDEDVNAEVTFINLMDGSDESKALIKGYNLKSVPFTIIKDEDGSVIKTIQGDYTLDDLNKYL